MDRLSKIDYKIYKPSGNPTALIYIKSSKKLDKSLNDLIMQKHPFVEQVGFVDDDFNLYMAGGERCINALRCAGLFYMEKFSLNEVEVKNLGEIFKCSKDEFGVFVASNFSDKFSVKKLKENEYLVNLGGITHLVNLENLENLNANELKKFGFEKIKSLNLDTLQASGFINIFNEFLKPVVFVKKINTLFYESACASGSLAASVVLNLLKNKTKFKLIQPSKKPLFVEIYKDSDKFISFKISGEILKNDDFKEKK